MSRRYDPTKGEYTRIPDYEEIHKYACYLLLKLYKLPDREFIAYEAYISAVDTFDKSKGLKFMTHYQWRLRSRVSAFCKNKKEKYLSDYFGEKLDDIQRDMYKPVDYASDTETEVSIDMFKKQLDEREIKILDLLLDGYEPKEIYDKMGLSAVTVWKVRKKLQEKFLKTDSI